jgi:FkbM family methyltransferase
MYPRLLAERFTQVYACEPDPLNHFVARLNTQVDNVHLFNAAVGQESGTFTGVFRSGMENVGMHKTGGQGPIPILAIDTLNLPTCGLIALDIEGYELWALNGARKTIERCSPVITCECPGQQVLELMTELGYVADVQSVSDTVFVRTNHHA